MRNKRLQNQVTAGRFTLPAVTLICTLCWVSTSFLFPQLASIPTQPAFLLAIHTELPASGLGGTDRQLPNLRHYRLFLNRTEQSVRHYPYEGFHADSHLLPVCHRLSGDASAICGRYCRFGFSDIHLFPVQKLPAITRGGLPFLFLPLYRNGKYHFSPTNCFFGTLDT